MERQASPPNPTPPAHTPTPDLPLPLPLPRDLFAKIFSFLPCIYIARCRLVCKLWNHLLSPLEFSHNPSLQHHEEWIAVFDGLSHLAERSIVLYDASTLRWQRICFAFLPPQFDIAVASAGGLLCVASRSAAPNAMCVCNPFTKAYRKLPDLRQELRQPFALMEEKERGAYRIYVMSGDLVAIYDSRNGFWIHLNIGEPERPRSPVICDGFVYGLRDEGSLWLQSCKVVAANLDQLIRSAQQLSYGALDQGQVWTVEWEEAPELVRYPRLLGGRGYLLLIGGLRKSPLSYSCSTFVIFRLDLVTLQWREISRMPIHLYAYFFDTSLIKVFGSSQNVFFLRKHPRVLAVCNLSTEQGEWRHIHDCPDFSYCTSDLCKGFSFNPRLGLIP